jgi:hypothetical protein
MISNGNIFLLPENAYLSSIVPIREKTTSLVHLAQVHSQSRGSVDAFLKCFPYSDVNLEKKALRNEIAAYLLAAQAGLPIAQEAYILIVQKEWLEKIHQEPTRPALTRNEYLAWGTKAIDGRPLRYVHRINEAEMKSRIKKWPGLPNVLAFDDWILNEDRTDDNLIAVNNGEFCLIDHAEIAGGILRDFTLIDDHTDCNNKLLKELFGPSAPNEIKSGMVFAAQQHRQIFDQACPKIENQFNKFSLSDKDSNYMLELINKRAANSEERIIKNHGMLL